MPSDTAKSTNENGIKMPKPTDHKHGSGSRRYDLYDNNLDSL